MIKANSNQSWVEDEQTSREFNYIELIYSIDIMAKLIISEASMWSNKIKTVHENLQKNNQIENYIFTSL